MSEEKKKGVDFDAYQVVYRPLVTEKGTFASEADNAYTFQVSPLATKTDIKRAVESLFQVKVEAVNTMNRPGKKRRERTMRFGRTSSWKKAVVTVKEGETIELL